MKISLEGFEKVFVVVSLLLYSGGPLTVILQGGASEGEGAPTGDVDSSIILILFFVNYFITFLLLALRWRKTIITLSRGKIITLLLGLAVISFFWSASPAKTLNRIIAIVGTSLFGVYLASRYTLKQQLQLIAWTFGVAIILSIAFAIGLPKFGIQGGKHIGAWRGIYTHKNVLGKMMVPSVVVFLILALDSRRKGIILWTGVFFSGLLVLLSTSTTSLLNLLVLLSGFVVLTIFRWSYKSMVPAISGLISLVGVLNLWLTENADAVLGASGKDTTLTGRTDLWPLALQAIGERPILGYGFGGFWNGLQGASSKLWYASGWDPPNAHNGLLDLWLNLGVIGVAIFMTSFLATAFTAFMMLRKTKTTDSLWYLLYMIYMIGANLTESSLMNQNDIFWVLYVAAVLSLATSFAQIKHLNHSSIQD